jgi:hypothetical protein
LVANIKGIDAQARLVKPAADSGVDQASLPQTEVDSVVREVVIRQPVGNVGIEPNVAIVRKSAGAIVRTAGTDVGNAFVKNAAASKVFVQHATVGNATVVVGNALVQHVAADNSLVQHVLTTCGNVLVQPADARIV